MAVAEVGHRRARVVGVVVAGGALAFGPQASAHYVNPGWFTVHNDQALCVWSMAEIGHDGQAPYVRGGVYGTMEIGLGPLSVACVNNPDAADVPPGGLAVATNLQKVVNGVTGICVDNGFRSNTQVVDELVVRHNHPTTPPCGGGEYEARSWSFVNFSNEWQGGNMRSGTHALPITGK